MHANEKAPCSGAFSFGADKGILQTTEVACRSAPPLSVGLSRDLRDPPQEALAFGHALSGSNPLFLCTQMKKHPARVLFHLVRIKGFEPP